MQNAQRRQRKKRRTSNKDLLDFSDQQLVEEIEEEWEAICSREDLSQMDREKEILKIYDEKKKRKKLEENQDLLIEGKAKLRNKQNTAEPLYEKHIDDQEEGEIVDNDKSKLNDKVPTPQEFEIHIKRLLLTRAKLEDLLNLPRFQEIITGCFIRYHSSKNNQYSISQILCTVESNSKVYKVGRVETNLLLRLQISANQIQNLSMDMVSNQTPAGVLEISRWLHSIGDRVPNINDLIKKKEEFEKKTVSEISTEDINKNIMKNIQKIIKKEREVREDLSSYLSFLNDRDHHIEVQLKELEERTNDDDTGGVDKERRGRFSREVVERPKITQTREELLEDKKRINQYLEKLKELRLIQLERKQEKKEVVKVKLEKVYDTRITREDRILARVNERNHRLGTASEVASVYSEILGFHKGADFHIDLKI